MEVSQQLDIFRGGGILKNKSVVQANRKDKRFVQSKFWHKAQRCILTLNELELFH